MLSRNGHAYMYCVMLPEATRSQVDLITTSLRDLDLQPEPGSLGARLVVFVPSDELALVTKLSSHPGVERVVVGPARFRFVERRYQPENSVIKVGDVPIGSGEPTFVAGPCAVESRDQILATATAVKAAGASILRGDVYKPRTSPYAFQGLGEEGLAFLAEARTLTGLPFVVEVVDPRHVEAVAQTADMLRIGTRNMSNYALLKEVGQQSKPVLLKRGRTAQIQEWLDAAEYIYDAGNHDIVLVERGIRTFETSTRNTLDISAVPVLKDLTHLPVMVDPSHASGRSELVAALARAAIAVGADGVLIDVHPEPGRALVDGDQAITPSGFSELMDQLTAISGVVPEPR